MNQLNPSEIIVWIMLLTAVVDFLKAIAELLNENKQDKKKR